MTTALTTGYLFPIPPLATGGIADGYGTLLQEADDHVKGDVNTLSGIVTTLSGSLTTTSGYLTTLSGSLTTLSGSLTTLSGSLTTTSGYVTTLSGAVTTLSGNVSTLSSYITTGWTDYSGISEIVGWSSFTTKILKYKKVGTLLFVSFTLNGTSDSASVTFTLPNTAAVDWRTPIWTFDGGATYATGVIYMSAGASIVTCKPTPDTGAVNWTPNGTKIAAGQFCYEVAI